MISRKEEVAQSTLRTRPPIISHQSNSVPSTPRQHAQQHPTRTRTPSPRKTAGNHSPKSVYSESSGLDAQRKGCEFEPAQTLGRRRFDWTTGSDEPLLFARLGEPMRLEGELGQRLAKDVEQLYDQLAPTEDSENRRRKFVTKLEGLLAQTWPETTFVVHLYGSSGNMLCTSDSDVDICIETPNRMFERVCHLAKMFARNGMQRVICMNFIKRVPIVKIWDPELKLACDMNVNNKIALWNTRMIRAYVKLDLRFRQLALIIKHWARRRRIHEAGPPGTLSSYTWTCMIINFLQTRDPSILPPLTEDSRDQAMAVENWEAVILRLEKFKGFDNANKSSLADLVIGFFAHYGHGVDYESKVISVRLGRLIPKSQKPNFTERLCVEEPFTPQKNLSASTDEYSVHGIHEELRRAFDHIRDGQLGTCCELYEYPSLPSEPRRRFEESLFEKPKPTLRPLLTRSSSQKSERRPGPSNPTRGGRFSQNPRLGLSSRRSSTSGNGQLPYPTLPRSPPNRTLGTDRSAPLTPKQHSLHDQLSQQYYFLEGRQAALRARLNHSQNTQADSLRQQLFAINPLGILYHYPLYYAPLPPGAQPTLPQGASTNPPSPSQSKVEPVSRRSQARLSDNDGMYSASARSQSQPARPVNTRIYPQTFVPANFDVSALAGQNFLAQPQPAVFNGVNGNLTATQAMSSGVSLADTLRQEGLYRPYIGYYLAGPPHMVSSTPQVMMHYRNLQLPQIPQYSELPHRGRGTSPDRTRRTTMDPLQEVSRSPSPVAQARSFSTGFQTPPMPWPESFEPPRHLQGNGPVIVNGSYPPTAVELTQHNLSQHDSMAGQTREFRPAAIHPSMFDSLEEDRLTRKSDVGQDAESIQELLQWQDQAERPLSESIKKTNGDVSLSTWLTASPNHSPGEDSDWAGHRDLRADTVIGDPYRPLQQGERFVQHKVESSIAKKPDLQTPTHVVGGDDHVGPHKELPRTLPMLSPVAETSTPSPGARNSGMPQGPLQNGLHVPILPVPPTPLAAADTRAETGDQNKDPASKATLAASKTQTNGTAVLAPHQNGWQQAGKKHKPVKSNQQSGTGLKYTAGSSPAVDSERKGG